MMKEYSFFSFLFFLPEHIPVHLDVAAKNCLANHD